MEKQLTLAEEIEVTAKKLNDLKESCNKQGIELYSNLIGKYFLFYGGLIVLVKDITSVYGDTIGVNVDSIYIDKRKDFLKIVFKEDVEEELHISTLSSQETTKENYNMFLNKAIDDIKSKIK